MRRESHHVEAQREKFTWGLSRRAAMRSQGDKPREKPNPPIPQYWTPASRAVGKLISVIWATQFMVHFESSLSQLMHTAGKWADLRQKPRLPLTWTLLFPFLIWRRDLKGICKMVVGNVWVQNGNTHLSGDCVMWRDQGMTQWRAC